MSTKIIKGTGESGDIIYDVYLNFPRKHSWDYYTIYIPSLNHLLFESLSGKYSEEYIQFCRDACQNLIKDRKHQSHSEE